MLNYSKLREIQLKEAESLEPVKLEKDFYMQLREFLETKKVSAVRNQSFMEMREYENARKVARNLVAKRREKLLMLSSISSISQEGLTEEEKVFLNQVRAISETVFAPVNSIFEEPKSEQQRSERIKVVKAIEAYKGSDNNIYGPYKEGEEVMLPSEEAEWLLKQKWAEHTTLKAT